jgi:hypothetical protein
MPELKITHGGKVHDVSVDRVHKIRKGDEEKALSAMRHDGADNLVFKGDNGDLFIASRVGMPRNVEINDRVEVGTSSRVEFNGVRGTLMGFDDERNQFSEHLKPILAGAGGGGVLGVAGVLFGALRLGFNAPLAMVGLVGAAVLGGGLLGGLFGRKKPNYDDLDKYTGGMELASAPIGQTSKPAVTLA